MKNLVRGLLVGTIFFLTSCQKDDDFVEPPFARQTITGLASPESIVKIGNRIFVSNIGTIADGFAEDGDGSISEISANGTIVKAKFQNSVLNAPKGLAVIGNTIYTADIERIVGFDLTTGNQVYEHEIAGETFFNDLGTINNTLIVSSTTSGNIYQLNLQTNVDTLLGNVPWVNGITWDSASNKLYACSITSLTDPNELGKLWVKNLAVSNDTFTTLPNVPVGSFDGIEMIDDHRIITDDWTNGNVFVYNLQNNTTTSYTAISSSGVADLWFEKSTQLIYFPATTSNSLIIDKLSNLK